MIERYQLQKVQYMPAKLKPACFTLRRLLAAAGEGTILAGRRGPLRQW